MKVNIRDTASIFLLTASLTVIQAEFAAKRTDFVTWREVRKNVLETKQQFNIKIYFTDPCDAIDEIFPWPQDYRKQDEKDGWVTYKKTIYCSRNFQSSIIEPMNALVEKFHARRSKRVAPFLGLIGGVWLSNVVDSIFNDNDEIAQHEEKQNAMLQALNKRQNYTVKSIIELSEKHNLLVDRVNSLYDAVDELERTLIRLQFGMALIESRFAKKKQAIELLRFGLINERKLNLQALNALLDTDHFEKIDSNSLEFLTIEKLNNSGYNIIFYGHRISERMRLYDVRAMSHWVNTTQSPSSLIRYSGPSKVLVNTQKNCVLGLYDLEPDSISQGCDKENWRSSDLEIWTTIRHGNPFIDVVQTAFVEQLPNINVYCFGRDITIKNETLSCPPYAIAIPANLDWSTSDRTFSGYQEKEMRYILNFTLPDFIKPGKLQEPNGTGFSDVDAIKRIYNLTALLEEQQSQTFILNTPIGGVSPANMNKILLCSFGCIVCILVLFWRHHHSNITRLTGHVQTQMERISKTNIGTNIPRNSLESPEIAAENW